MRTEFYLRQVRRLMTGHAIPAISTDDLSQVLVPIPDPSEQTRIANAIAEIQAMRKHARQASEQVVIETNALVGQLG
jgi:type I restriction enzyme M protein